MLAISVVYKDRRHAVGNKGNFKGGDSIVHLFNNFLSAPAGEDDSDITDALLFLENFTGGVEYHAPPGPHTQRAHAASAPPGRLQRGERAAVGEGAQGGPAEL